MSGNGTDPLVLFRQAHQVTNRLGLLSTTSRQLTLKCLFALSLISVLELIEILPRPLWYKWSEAKRQATDSLDFFSARDCPGVFSTLMEPKSREEAADLYVKHPSTKETSALWNLYLSHVHPMNKLFFSWEKEPLMQKAANNPQSLSKSEQAFCFATYFITILSLSDEEAKGEMGGSSKSQLLDDFQSSAETALFTVGFMDTSDLLVLQAFLLYIVMLPIDLHSLTY
jgi:hypothetical protein